MLYELYAKLWGSDVAQYALRQDCAQNLQVSCWVTVIAAYNFVLMICSISCHHRLCWWKSIISNDIWKKVVLARVKTLKARTSISGSWSSNSCLWRLVSITSLILAILLVPIFFFFNCCLVTTVNTHPNWGLVRIILTISICISQMYVVVVVMHISYVYLMFYFQWNGASFFCSNCLPCPPGLSCYNQTHHAYFIVHHKQSVVILLI